MRLAFALGLFSLTLDAYGQSYSTTYNPTSLPATSESGQSGTNQCGTGFNETESCQNAWVNSVSDFCLFASPTFAEIGVSERVTVSYCTSPKYGARSIPIGTLQAVHFLQAPDYIQISGSGNLTNLNIEGGDGGGELDPHGADGNGNPIGGLVFTTAFGGGGPLGIQIHEWTMFVSNDVFCVRLCKPGPNATKFCAHIYDELGCLWNIPGDYDAGFSSCDSDDVIPMGLYPQPDGSTSTFHQGEPTTPDAHPAAASSSCTPFSSDIFAAAATSSIVTSTTSSSSASSATSTSGGSSGAAGATSGTGSSGGSTTAHGSGAASKKHVGGEKYLLAFGAVNLLLAFLI